MEFVSVRDLRIQPGQVWRRLSKAGELVLTLNGKPIALLSSVSDSTLEQTLVAFRQARAQAAVSQIRATAQARGLAKLSNDEIDAEIQSSRRSRTTRPPKRR